MTDKLNVKLEEAIREATIKIQRFQGRVLGEQDTKASLIEPILEALGWDIRDPDEVSREFKPTTQDKPVDYCLSLLRKPRLMVEAKPLNETLADRKWIGQILGYATVAGVEWCILTDGNEYRFYNATVPLDADEKLFFQLKLSESSVEDAARKMRLVSRSDLSENLLEVLWSAHYVDRRVRLALQEMLSTRDKALIRVIRKRIPKLTPREIVEALRRLDVHIEIPTLAPESASHLKGATTKQQKGGKKHRRPEKRTYNAKLQDLIGAGLLSPPVRLFRKYRGRVMEATLLPQGTVEFEGRTYDSSSTAAEVARSTVTGRRMHTNGWDFWQYQDTAGKTLTLFDVRQKFLAMKGKGS
jgi:hypothetical protein